MQEEPNKPKRTYLATLRVGDCIHPSQKAKSVGVNLLFRDGDFVWTKYIPAYDRTEAVRKASDWFFSMKCSQHAKTFIPHTKVTDMTVDDPHNEVFFYKKFRCFDSNNKLLEESKIDQLIEESEGQLRRAKNDRKTFACRSSVEWNRNDKRMSYRAPGLKWTGYPNLYFNESNGSFYANVKKARQKTEGTKYEFRKNPHTVAMPRKEGDGRRVWTGKVIDIKKGKRVQELRYHSIRLKAKDLDAAKVECDKHRKKAEKL